MATRQKLTEEEKAARVQQKRDRDRERQAGHSKAGQDIGNPPLGPFRERKELCRYDLELFERTYFPVRFEFPSSEDMKEVTRKAQAATLNGGLYALAMPRGSGKTTKLIVVTIWSLLYGHHHFVILAGATDPKADDLVDAVKYELSNNDLLEEDFPEVCYPVRALQNRANRAKGQHIRGKDTRIKWSSDELVLPYVDGSVASGAILRVGGITGSLFRGSLHFEGGRPSLAFIDDPQNDKTAKSFIQCKSILDVINSGIIPMAGPGKSMTVFVLCTVIQKGDVADTLLDRKKSPRYVGDKYKLLYEFPENMRLWEEYQERKESEMRNGEPNYPRATAWYAAQREQMDKGARVAWEYNFKPHQISALQHAMDWFFDDPRTFHSEYQNSPLGDEDQQEQLDPVLIAARQLGFERGVVPLAMSHVTAFVDVGKECLWGMACGWSQNFTGHILDYGTYPDQQRSYFTKGDIQRTLAKAAPGAGPEGQVWAALEAYIPPLMEREFFREDGSLFKIERMLIDANWGPMTKTIDAWIRQSKYANIILPSHGHGITAARKPWDQWVEHEGEKLGTHWLLSNMSQERKVRYVLMDSNYWKTFVSNRLKTSVGDRGALTLFGKGRVDHQMVADHFTAEYWIETHGRGRKLTEWTLHVGRDNDWWDCLYGNAVAASMQGVFLPESQVAKAKVIVVKSSDQYWQKHGGRPGENAEPSSTFGRPHG